MQNSCDGMDLEHPLLCNLSRTVRCIVHVRVLCLIQRKLLKSVLSVDDMLNLGLSLLAVGPPSQEVSDGKTRLGAYETKPATENSPPATDLHYASIS